MSFIIPRIAVIGLGLIGGSWVKALRTREHVSVIAGFDTNLEAMQAAKAEGVIDFYHQDIAKVVQGADLVILSVPILAIRTVLESIAPHIGTQTVLTDVGSVKGYV
ncbi:MAG TPA: prephenate dehydrogenase/arogenate dehydrogenase family protein, partial [Pseudomonadales bacterium]|nr:prephenate dehydrogenase/arogenate dehydrogenase family protein [Pseudomonadales bacterium]